VFLTGNTGYTRTRGTSYPYTTRPDPTRETSTRPDPYPRVRVGSGIPAGGGRPAHLYCRCALI